jgi:hypothetical protein
MPGFDFDPYLRRLEALEERELCFGGRCLLLFAGDELEDAQLGFSIGPQGHELCGDEPGDWRRSWLVIGEDDEHGDPIFVDLAEPGLPVYTAIVGEGEWEPVPVARSWEGFVRVLEHLRERAKGRESFEDIAEHPLHERERREILSELAALQSAFDLRYWQDWLEGLEER